MAAVITAVDIGLSGVAAVVAAAYDATVIRMVDRYRAAIVEDVAQSVPESPIRFRILTVGDDSSVELINLFEAVT
jgi:hypothetical protein